MKKVLLIICFLSHSFAEAQQLYAVFQGGYTGYGGDLSEKNISTKFLSPAFGVGLHLEASQHLSLNANWMHGKIKGDDKFSPQRAYRNLKFDSDIKEYSFSLQYNFLKRDQFYFSPFVTGGLAVFSFNPYIESGVKKYYLHDYHTEGQGVYEGVQPYRLTQFSIPWGGGIEWVPNEDTRIGVTAVFRKTFTDYLDDVSGKYAPKDLLADKFGPLSVSFAYRGNLVPGGSNIYPDAGTPRGNPNNKDVYYFFGLYLKMRFKVMVGAIDDRKGGTSDGVRLDCPKW